MYYIDENVDEEEIGDFLAKYEFEIPKFPDVPALKQEFAERFIHAVRQRSDGEVMALICGVSYERNLNFDVLMPINISFDVLKILSARYFKHYYQMNQNPNRLTWRLNGLVQQNPISAEVAFPLDNLPKLNRVLKI